MLTRFVLGPICTSPILASSALACVSVSSSACINPFVPTHKTGADMVYPWGCSDCCFWCVPTLPASSQDR